MRLVIQYNNTDGHTFHLTETVPIEYESAEKFLIDFEEQHKSCYSAKGFLVKYTFHLAGWEFEPSLFEDELPTVLTVDEWYHQNQRD
jgi:hypothetical protein